MNTQHTLPLHLAGLPVQALRVEVTEGPDAGTSFLAQSESITVGTAHGNDLILKDPTVSRYHLQLTLRPDGIAVEDTGSTNGTRYESARVERAVLPPGSLLKLGHTALRVGRGENVTVALHGAEVLAGLRGRSASMRRLMAQVSRAAQADQSVLVVGESGTGKELIARALHDLGPRRERPFVTVDCGALTPTLVASELFGHERGAFTGADRQHAGAFERADGGTVFLDEIGELPASLQSNLLGVLERRRFRRLGGKSEINVNVRVVAATNRDLRADVNGGSFRLDLYYRLAVVVLHVPALRERPEDVPVLVEHFLRECGHDGPVESLISPQAMGALAQHRWPGNVRELRNLVEATVAMGEAPALHEGVAGQSGAAGAGITPGGAPAAGDAIGALLGLRYKEARAQLLEQFEKRYLADLLARCDGNVSRAARESGVDRSHLTDLIQRHGLK